MEMFGQRINCPMRGLRVLFFATVLAYSVNCYGAPDQTMSVVPAAVSGTTINAADENTRNSNVSTPYNAHSHTDISTTTANTFSVGDGLAGNKDIVFNAADTTDVRLRWNDTANLVTIDHPTAGSFNQVATISGTAGVTGILQGDVTSSVRQFAASPGADDQTLVSDSTTAGTFRALPNCTDTGGNHINYTTATNAFSCGTSGGATSSTIVNFARTGAAGTGTQAVTGMGFQPTSLWVGCTNSAGGDDWTIAFGDDAAGETAFEVINASVTRNTARLVVVQTSGGNNMLAVLDSMDTDGFTVTWTENGTGPDVDCLSMGVR